MRSVAIITGPQTHLDHLGPLSSVLDIPLVVTEESTYRAAKTFYPDLNVSLLGLDELSIGHLAENYDAIFQTGKFWAAELKPFLELLYNKKMRFVFCPHGNSDKGHSLQTHAEQDVSLVYGDHLRELLERTGATQKIGALVRTGNYRLPYYLRHQGFYDALAQKMVFDRFREKKPVILYAPTYNDKENPTSFFSAVDQVVQELAPHFNVLIKLHPFLIEDQPAQVYKIMGAYENHPSVVILEEFAPIYPLLAKCDAYLGDYSSIGYDFLAFDRPMYFLNEASTSPLHACGMSGMSEIFNTMEFNKTHFSAQRKKIYLYAFGEEIGEDQLKWDINKALY